MKHIKSMMMAAGMLLIIPSANAQWRTEFSGNSTAQRGLFEMSAPDNRNCYATTYDQNNFYNFLNEISVTHGGGDTWSLVTIDGH